ncbi:hypothetical protein NW761_014761 [Fusarium oxysporum]|uniref:Uncharacterized protein n=1 Tax=Fusarium oxysporum f. sp. melonis 26406 TaxID=1089452 RepID=W9Z214_FUSOX|nr:hypothetical protein FOMG_17910 [Fusarium oxysporum f. sp. melonis 26406]KAJ4028855.1 hypothetical protein NW753_014436 [Fusarium oxysporum]KAJ4034948.1 hypothetical protein NW763_014179 [Fusarium oxysporum]KAJ4051426.1 hypothetical protein NW758_003768 [Fusarium oxysporum]KAJ4072585.1 hypothetical protein NW761_014761 [Fusarium oxysporum]
MPFLISIRAPFHAGPSHNTMAYVGHNLCLESRAARCCRCQYPETYSRYIEIIRGSELACIAVNLIHAIKAFQASKDEDKNVSPLLANLQDQQTHAREA